MVRVLIDLRRTIAQHQLATSSPAALWMTVLLAVLSAVATLLSGWVTYPHPATAIDVSALVAALWVGGRLAQSAISAEPVLRPELFALLPLARRRLARALLLVGLLDPANLLLAVALAATIRVGARLGLAATLTAVAGVGLTVLVASVLATLVAGLLGPGSRRGHDAATVFTAVMISLLAVAGTLMPALVSALRDRSVGWLPDLLRALPSGWGARAVAAAGHADVAGTVVPLSGLALLTGAVVLVWPSVLERRLHTRRAGRRAGVAATRSRGGLLGRGAVAAVAEKELRLWARDPIRLTFLLIAGVVGTATCVLPRVTSGFDQLQPFGGALTVLIAAACACNLYGNDGSSLWLMVMSPGAARADVRGRQLAWLLVVAPYAVVSTAVLSAAGSSMKYALWAGALSAALLGGGAGVAAFGSLIWVQPLDDAGNPTPAWSLKVHLALVAVAMTALPALSVLVTVGPWCGLLVGVLTGVAVGTWLGSLAGHRLSERQLEILEALRGGAPS